MSGANCFNFQFRKNGKANKQTLKACDFNKNKILYISDLKCFHNLIIKVNFVEYIFKYRDLDFIPNQPSIIIHSQKAPFGKTQNKTFTVYEFLMGRQ